MTFKFDGKTRISNDNYRKEFDRIFKTNPVAKEVRTPKLLPGGPQGRFQGSPRSLQEAFERLPAGITHLGCNLKPCLRF